MRRVLFGHLARHLAPSLFAISASMSAACVGLDDLAGKPGSDLPTCPANQQILDGRCVDAPPSKPASPNGECAEGLQDNDKDLLCEASCSTAKLGCTGHTRCDDSKGKASCVCATGYVREAQSCVWRGGPRDPGFQNTPVAWAVTDANIEPAANATVDPGRARFSNKAICSSTGVVKQSFAMPAFADAEPFALTVQGQQSNDLEPSAIAVFFGNAYGGDGRFTNDQKTRFCLGDSAYGGDVELRIRSQAAACSATSTLDLDRASIDPAPDCPAPGRVVNGDFEGTGGWAASGAGAEVATAVGTSGGRGGRISTTNLCQSPSLSGAMSAPSKSLGNVALSFSYKGTKGQRMHVEGGLGSTLGVVTGTATFQEAKLCVPQWAKGAVANLRFRLLDPGGLCADPNVRDFVFDDLKFLSDPKCAAQPYVVDGGFENVTNEVASWLLDHDTLYSTDAEVVRAADQAHSGTAYVRLATSQPCHYGRAKQTITVPEPVGGAGPAVKLWYRLPVKTKANFETTPGGALDVSATWKQKVICLDPTSAGRPLAFTVEADGGGGTCADYYASEHLDLDDVEATTDPSCPATK